MYGVPDEDFVLAVCWDGWGSLQNEDFSGEKVLHLNKNRLE